MDAHCRHLHPAVPRIDIAAEESDLAQTIRACKPDMIWVGIGTPRQDLFMRRMLPCLETRLMLGVGAAFDFHAGRLKECAPWVKNMGLHWLHRLLQDPRRLWRRNAGNAAFLWPHRPPVD